MEWHEAPLQGKTIRVLLKTQTDRIIKVVLGLPSSREEVRWHRKRRTRRRRTGRRKSRRKINKERRDMGKREWRKTMKRDGNGGVY